MEEKLTRLISILKENPKRDVYKIDYPRERKGHFTFSNPGNTKQILYSFQEISQLVNDGWLVDKYPEEKQLIGDLYKLSEWAIKNLDGNLSVCCEDCKMPYSAFGFDTSLPNYQWKRIIKQNDGAGILCANCIIKRGAKAFPKATVVKMRFSE